MGHSPVAPDARIAFAGSTILLTGIAASQVTATAFVL
jgi:hypothetical protein